MNRSSTGKEACIYLDQKPTFSVRECLECGQAFRHIEIEENYHEVIVGKKRLRIDERSTDTVFYCTAEAFNDFWQSYFDLQADYFDYQQRLIAIDERLAPLIERHKGVRILRQDPFEMLITFILSQNKSMVQIKQLVNRLSETYGEKLEDAYGVYYAFPTPSELAEVSDAEFRSLKVGFRAPYLVGAVDAVVSGTLSLTRLEQLPTGEAREALMSLKGVGQKVADCILLFAYHRMDVFPLDVWMKRAVRHLYFESAEVSDKKLRVFAEEKFGNLGGIAQQYIFYSAFEGNVES